MFRVHRDQVAAFAAEHRADFETRLAACLEANEVRLPLHALRLALGRAAALGFESEADVADYVWLEAIAGGDVGEVWPFAREVLAQRSLSPTGKLRVIRRAAAERGLAPDDLPSFSEPER